MDEKPGAKKSEMNLVTDTELLARFYGENDGDLDHTEKFLKNYILNEGWKEKASKSKKSISTKSSMTQASSRAYQLMS